MKASWIDALLDLPALDLAIPSATPRPSKTSKLYAPKAPPKRKIKKRGRITKDGACCACGMSVWWTWGDGRMRLVEVTNGQVRYHRCHGCTLEDFEDLDK